MKRTQTIALLLFSVIVRPGAGQAKVTQLTFESVWPTTKTECAWAPDGDWIAYCRGAVYGQYAAYGLHRVSPSGGPQQPLGPMDANGPQWVPEYSADGQWIHFLKQDPTTLIGGFPSRMPANGGQWQVLGTRSCPGQRMVSVSRNGNDILYAFGRVFPPSSGLAIGLVRVAQGADLTLLPGPMAIGLVQISPLSSIGGFSGGYPFGIVVIGPFGIQYVYLPPSGIMGRWGWGPTGELMSFDRGSLYILDLRDSSLRALIATPGGVNDLLWSPCGQYIALSRGFTGSPTLEFTLVEVSSGSAQPLVKMMPPTMISPTWSPFRDEIAFLDASSVTGQPEVFKLSTGLSPTPAVFGTMVPGTTTTVRIRATADANRPYVIAAALGRDQGIPTARGRIPLDLDPLLVASLSGIPPFRGFQGIIDGNGRADAFIDVPPVGALEGLRVFVGYVTLDSAQPAGIRTISGSVPVFVQPPW